LGIGPVVDAIGLETAEFRQRSLGHGAGVEHRGLPPRGERVAAKEGRIERQAGLRHQPLVLGAFQQHE